MWFKKEEENIKESEPKHVGEVKCETCKHWIDRSDAQEIKTLGSYWHGYLGTSYWDEDEVVNKQFYCPIHRTKYDLIRKQRKGGPKYIVLVPATEKEVNEDGSEIKMATQKTVKK